MILRFDTKRMLAMKTGRRAFLCSAGAMSAATAAVAQPLAALAAGPGGQELRRSHFMPLLGQGFTVAQVQSTLTLQSLHALSHSQEAERSFRAVFTVQGEGLAQNTWQISHPALGSHAVFLSPNDADGRLVEAVFNRG